MKIFILFLCFVIVSGHLMAQKVSFFAKDKKSDRDLYMDSVVVINTTNSQRLIIKGKFYNVDLGPISSTDDINFVDRPIAEIYYGLAEAYLSLNIPAEAEVKISVFDLMGRRVSELSENLIPGRYTHVINSNLLYPGLYFINVTDGKISRTLKYLSKGESNIAGSRDLFSLYSSGPESDKIILSKDKYNFIGYFRNCQPDTIKDFKPSDGDQITFRISTLNGIFTDGKIILNIHDARFQHIYRTEEIYRDNRIDTSNETKVLLETLPVDQGNWAYSWDHGTYQGYCLTIAEPDSSIYFCYDQSSFSDEDQTDSFREMKLYLDTTKKIIIRLEYNRITDAILLSKPNPNHWGAKITKDHLSLTNIPYTSENGNLSAVIDFNSYKDHIVYSYDRTYNFGSSSLHYYSTDTFLGFTDPVDDSSTIEIRLNK